jgi:hypothetical protein
VCKLVNQSTDHLHSNGLLTVAQDWLGAQPVQLSVMTELPARAFPTYDDACLLGLASQHFVEGRDTLLRAQDVSKIVFNSNLPSRREFFLGASASRVGYRQEITIVSANVLEAANDLADVMTRAIVISGLEGSSSILVSAFAFRGANGMLVQSRFPPHGPYTVQVGKDTAVVMRAEPIPNPSGLPGRGGSSSSFAANSLFLLQLERRIPEVQGVVARLIRSYMVDSMMNVTQLLVEMLQPDDPKINMTYLLARGTPMVIDVTGGASALEVVFVHTERGSVR